MSVISNNENGFKGFSLKTFNFLRDLKANNNKSWFEENRQVYEKHVLTPLKELVVHLWPVMIEIDPKFDINSVPNKAISRIYRDTRFSKDKSPYKSNMWITFKRQSKDWKEFPCFFFEIHPDSYRYGMGFYCATKDTMDKLREAIDSKPKVFLKTVSPLSQTDFVIEGDKYKKILDPTKSEEFNNWYQRKNLYITCNKPIDERLFSTDLVDDLITGFKFLKNNKCEVKFMQNPLYFAISAMIMVIGLVVVFIREQFVPVGSLVMLLGLLLMIHWNTISYNWKCDECGKEFEIDMFKNFTGLNGGINHKYLKCPQCNKRTWCKGIPRKAN